MIPQPVLKRALAPPGVSTADEDVRHQATGVTLPTCLPVRLARGGKGMLSILVIPECHLALVPAVHHTVSRAGILHSQFPRHARGSPRQTPFTAFQRATASRPLPLPKKNVNSELSGCRGKKAKESRVWKAAFKKESRIASCKFSYCRSWPRLALPWVGMRRS